jgi:serine/threonine protein kinase
MVAKVGDFGLSKMISIEGASHVTTMAKGTAGYIDPEYVKNLTLNLLWHYFLRFYLEDSIEIEHAIKSSCCGI